MDIARFAITGAAVGGVYALLGMSIVVVHRGSGVLNFAAAAIGMIGTFTCFRLYQSAGLPFIAALMGGLLVSAMVGLTLHLGALQWLRNTAATTRIVATLGWMTFLIGVGNLVFAPRGEAIGVPAFLPTGLITAFDLNIGVDRPLILGIAVVVTVGLVMIQRRTYFGLATSAVVEDQLIAGSMGLSPAWIAGLNWVIGSALAALALTLVSPISGLAVLPMTLLVVPAMAAALVGSFDSYPMTLFGGLAIGISQSLASRFITEAGWPTALPLVVIIVALVFQGSYIPGKGDVSERLPRVGTGRITPAAIGWFGLVAAITVVIADSWLNAITLSLLMGLVVISVVVVTGLTGQLSLVQLSLAGIGAMFTATFVVLLNLPMSLSILLAALATVPVGLAVAVPAVRARGSRLAIASLSLAVVIDALVLNNQELAGKLVGPLLTPLTLFGLQFDSFDHPRNFALLLVAVVALVVLMVCNLRRGRAGRRMLATRSNERAALSLGINVAGVKLYAFALGALIAGLAGGFVQAQLFVADYTGAFPVLDSINIVLVGVLGGLGGTSGALVGGTMANGGAGPFALSYIVDPGNWFYIVSGLTAIIVVLQSGNGLVPFWIDQWRWLVKRVVPSSWSRPGRSALATGDAKAGDALSVQRPSDASRHIGGGKALEVRGINVFFGGQQALADVDLAIHPGEVVGLIGPNGGGKSTLVDVVTGFNRRYQGTVLLDGKSIDALSPSRRARAGLGRSFQNLELFEDLSVRDNIKVASDSCGSARYIADLVRPGSSDFTDIAALAVQDFALEPYLDEQPVEVDYGTRRLVAIARSMAANPAVLLLDEPAAGLDANAREELATLIRQLAAHWNVGVLLIEHDVDLVFGVCDSVFVLNEGRILASGSPGDVRANSAVVNAYLGQRARHGENPHELTHARRGGDA